MVIANEKNEQLVKLTESVVNFVNTINFKKDIRKQNTVSYCPINDTYGLSIRVDLDVCEDPFVWFTFSKGPIENGFNISETSSYSIKEESIERAIKKLLRKHEILGS